MRKPTTDTILVEEGNVPVEPTNVSTLPLEVQNLSLDMKVDNYFMKYEKESLPTQQTYAVPGTDTGFSMEEGFLKIWQQLITEAADDAPDTSMPGTEGDSPVAPAQPPAPKVSNPRFNVSNFTQSVARLVLNYDGLLDPKTTIMNRARAYLEKNYDAGVAKQMMEILDREFGMVPRQQPDAPFAGGAGLDSGESSTTSAT